MEDQQIKNKAILDKTDISQFLIFKVAKNIFGINVNYVQEVVDLDCIYQVPLMSDVISGVINLRGVIVPVMDLSVRFYDTPIVKDASTKIIIIEIDDEGETVDIGVLVDSVISVVDIAHEMIKPAPEFGVNIRSDFISKSVKINDDFIVLADIHAILNINEISALNADMSDINKSAITETITTDDAILQKDIIEKHDDSDNNSFIIFTIENESYGIPTKRLHKIVIPDEIIPIPNTLPFMKGVINLQGTAVPVVDFRIRCNLNEKKYETKPWIFIVEVKKILIGIIIESVSELVLINKNAIQPTLHYTAAIDRDFISGIAEVKDRFIIIPDIDKILTNEELDRIYMLKENTVNI